MPEMPMPGAMGGGGMMGGGAAMPPAPGAAPSPAGAQAATPMDGMRMRSSIQVAIAIKLLSRALGGFDPRTEEGLTIVDALKKLGSRFSAKADPRLEQSEIQALQSSTSPMPAVTPQQRQAFMQQMKAGPQMAAPPAAA